MAKWRPNPEVTSSPRSVREIAQSWRSCATRTCCKCRLVLAGRQVLISAESFSVSLRLSQDCDEGNRPVFPLRFGNLASQNGGLLPGSDAFVAPAFRRASLVSGRFSSATADERYEVLHSQNRQAEACPTGIILWLACRLTRRLPRGCSISSCNPSPCGSR
jgi:hypothetical protein